MATQTWAKMATVVVVAGRGGWWVGDGGWVVVGRTGFVGAALLVAGACSDAAHFLIFLQIWGRRINKLFLQILHLGHVGHVSRHINKNSRSDDLVANAALPAASRRINHVNFALRHLLMRQRSQGPMGKTDIKAPSTQTRYVDCYF